MKYWRVTFKSGKKEDVPGDRRNIDGHNNLQFLNDIGLKGEPVATFHREVWRACIQIDEIGGVPVWEKETRPQLTPLTDPN